jgi:hypothetical protein
MDGMQALIVETSHDQMFRYAYGDWQWYALRQTGPAEASSALLWPSRAALGRRELPGPFSPAAVSREVRVPIEHALYLTVDARDVRSLVDRLDGIFFENSAARIYNEAYDLVFVPHPEPYSMSHNSNQVVGNWLEQLQCRVEGPTLFSIWKRGTDRPEEPWRKSGPGATRGSARRPAATACAVAPGGAPRRPRDAGATAPSAGGPHRDSWRSAAAPSAAACSSPRYW